MSCFFLHNWEWRKIGKAQIYCNLMGGCARYIELEGTCKDCGLIKTKLTRA